METHHLKSDWRFVADLKWGIHTDVWFSQPLDARLFPVGCTDVLRRGAVAAVAGLQWTHVAFKRQNFMPSNWDKQQDTSSIFEHLCELISFIIGSRNIWSILKTESMYIIDIINVHIPNFKNMSLLPQKEKRYGAKWVRIVWPCLHNALIQYSKYISPDLFSESTVEWIWQIQIFNTCVF